MIYILYFLIGLFALIGFVAVAIISLILFGHYLEKRKQCKLIRILSKNG